MNAATRLSEATTCLRVEGREAGLVNLDGGGSEWGLGPVWIGDLCVVLQKEWGHGTREWGGCLGQETNTHSEQSMMW